MNANRERAVRQVLQGLTYPAEKWQIVTQAELYGADAQTRGELYRLPMGEYRDTSDVTTALHADETAAGDGGRVRESSPPAQ